MGWFSFPIAGGIGLMINKMLLVSFFVCSDGEPVAFRDGFRGWLIHLSLAPGEELRRMVVGGGRGRWHENVLIRKDPAGLSHHLKDVFVLLGARDDGQTG
jgi:hypothetical protein